ncbi:ABC transporter substrate-binding protein [Streptomyces sp. NPDC020983]|uniref:ABC transporter substrate-binding protein n=1 Tax=Streptomyces sp. NPDC020983 TaxID=3365106 RepID=UPI00379C3531
MPYRRGRGRSRYAAAAVLLLGTLVGCGTAQAGGGGQVLRFATDTQPDCLDPQVSPDDITAVIDRNIFDSLVDVTSDGTVHPWLATRWKVSPDGLVYTFTLREGVTFQDGTPLDAAAVKATLDHAVAPATKSQYAVNLISGYREATVLDPHTVTVRLARPSASFLQALGTPYLGIQSPTSLRENAGKLCRHLVGSGPFRFTGWKTNRSIDMVRNDAYDWGPQGSHAGPAYVRGLQIQFVPENSVRFGMLTSGQTDVAGGLPPAEAGTLSRASGFRLAVAQAPGGVYTAFFNSRRGPLKDERVRLALTRAVRIDQLVKSIYFGRYQRAWSPLSPATVDYDPSLAGSWRYDPALAARLLDQAGWTGRDPQGYRTKDGRRLTLKWPYTQQLIREQRDILGQGIQAEARRAGIDIEYVKEDAGAFIKDIVAGNADMHAFSFERAEPDVLRYPFASDQTLTHGGGNVFGVRFPQLDGWLDEAARSGDPAVRAADYAKAQRYIVRHAVAMPLYVPQYLAGVSGRVSGLRFDAQSDPVFFDVRLEGS